MRKKEDKYKQNGKIISFEIFVTKVTRAYNIGGKKKK